MLIMIEKNLNNRYGFFRTGTLKKKIKFFLEHGVYKILIQTNYLTGLQREFTKSIGYARQIFNVLLSLLIFQQCSFFYYASYKNV